MTIQTAVNQRTRRTYRPELVITPGPAALGAPGGGTYPELYGYAWALAWHQNQPQLLQQQSGTWASRNDLGALVDLPTTARHLALAFDQSARPVIAWEHEQQVRIRQFDGITGQYITRGPWTGRDPLLIADAVLMQRTDTSDVLLIHMDDTQVIARVQRETYSTAYPLASVAAGTVLDQIVTAALVWYLLGETPDGAELVLKSPPYPLTVVNNVDTSQEITGLLLELQVTTGDVDTLSSTLNLTGELADTGLKLTIVEPLQTTQSLTGNLMTVTLAMTFADAVLSTQAISGTLNTVVITATPTDSLGTTQSITGAFS